MTAKKKAEFNAVQSAAVQRSLRPVSNAREQKKAQAAKIRSIKQVLVEAGYRTVAEQAKALGLSRSSAWAVLNGSHKQTGLTANSIAQILKSPCLPDEVRIIVIEYANGKCAGLYGHPESRLKLFRKQIFGLLRIEWADLEEDVGR